jgi:hypothetical protein
MVCAHWRAIAPLQPQSDVIAESQIQIQTLKLSRQPIEPPPPTLTTTTTAFQLSHFSPTMLQATVFRSAVRAAAAAPRATFVSTARALAAGDTGAPPKLGGSGYVDGKCTHPSYS